MRKLEKIEIVTFKEIGMFSAVIKFEDQKLVTQGNNYPELMKNIGEILLIKLENEDSFVKSSINEKGGVK